MHFKSMPIIASYWTFVNKEKHQRKLDGNHVLILKCPINFKDFCWVFSFLPYGDSNSARHFASWWDVVPMFDTIAHKGDCQLCQLFDIRL